MHCINIKSVRVLPMVLFQFTVLGPPRGALATLAMITAAPVIAANSLDLTHLVSVVVWLHSVTCERRFLRPGSSSLGYRMVLIQNQQSLIAVHDTAFCSALLLFIRNLYLFLSIQNSHVLRTP